MVCSYAPDVVCSYTVPAVVLVVSILIKSAKIYNRQEKGGHMDKLTLAIMIYLKKKMPPRELNPTSQPQTNQTRTPPTRIDDALRVRK